MSDERSTPSESTTTNSASVSWSTRWQRLSLVQYLPLKFRRYAGRMVIAGVALIAAILVSIVTVDLGPAVRAQAERAASTQLDRPVHIGRLGTYLLPGRFLVEDLVIEGLSPGDDPFFTADRIIVSTSWLALLRGEILVDDVEIGPWRMVAENFQDGRQSFPQFVPQDETRADSAVADDDVVSDQNNGRRIVTTVQKLLAHDGEFIYRDHNVPWNVTARNVDLTMAKGDSYGGELSFTDGLVEIMAFEPMKAEMRADYELDDGDVNLTQIDLTMNGFYSDVIGKVDIANWPEQTYQIVDSDIDLPAMKDIFFAGDPFTVAGDARFVGEWHIFDGGRELTGRFQSDDWTLNGLAFPDTNGSLVWTRDRFEVFDYMSGFYGGEAKLTYLMAPLGTDEQGMATLDTTVTDVDVLALSEAVALAGVRPEGVASGRNLLRWPLGQFDSHTGTGRFEVTAPSGSAPLMTPQATGNNPSAIGSYAAVEFSPVGEAWRFPVGGEVTYTIKPDWIEIAPSRLATPATCIEFEGKTAFGEESNIPFKVSSIDWQESDRLMSAFMTAFGRDTNEFLIGGRGHLNGVMLGTFSRPRIEASFDGMGIEAWNVPWGLGMGRVVVENSYLDVVDGVFERDGSVVQVDGRFAIGFPRVDGGEEINARFDLASFPAQRLRDVFAIEGYEINGPLTGEIHLYGYYREPFGFGSLSLAEPEAWGEPFDFAAAGLRFEGVGVRMDGLEIGKGSGQLTGATFIRWDGTYSFNIDGRDIPLESIRGFGVRRAGARVGGSATFAASGAGLLADPSYEVRGAISDLSVNDEIVGQLSGRVNVREGLMRIEVEAGSPSLAISGSGRVDLSAENDADLLFRFTNTTLDPYVRAYTSVVPQEASMVVSGTLQLTGPLQNIDALLVQATIEQLELGVFDYLVRNHDPVELVLDDNVLRVQHMNLVGEGTALTVLGQIDLVDEQIALRAEGDANLGFLQGFVPDLRSSGTGNFVAEINGTFRQPIIVGSATVDGGRVRHLSLPHSLEDIEGEIVFEPNSIRFDALRGVMADGQVQFGGRVGLRGYEIGELNISASASEMKLRFPEGIRSVVDAELTLGGEIDDAVLAGRVDVRDAVWLNVFEPSTEFLSFADADSGLVQQSVESTLPLRYDVRIVAPSSLRISDNRARIVSSAELTLSGTFDRPVLLGNAEIERGEVFFEGNRYRVTRGSIAFADPTSTEPFFDIEAETDIRVPGQTYRVTIGVSGTMDRLDPELSSDPPLQETEILSLLLGDIRDPQAAEIRALRAQEASRQELLQAGAARLLTSPISSGVGRVVEESFGVDSFEITPALDPATLQSTQLVPTARLLIGKRISDRAHVTFSRAVSGANQDLIVVLEYDQNDRLSWIVSQNEDRTYALDFRVRHAF